MSVLERCRRRLARLFEIERWNIGVIQRRPGDLSALITSGYLGTVRWCPPASRKHYRADPFLWAPGDGARLIFEEHSYWYGRARICSIPLAIDGAAPSRPEITGRTHLSYPLAFEADGAWYCLPENSESGGVTIYQWRESGGCWHRLATLIDEAVLDPTPVLHEGTWYVFGTLLDDGPESQLFIWHSQSLLGPWTRHQHGPTRSGHKDRRSAGKFFSHGNALYRPAQDGSGGYGGAVIIYRVDQLSSETYRETEVARVVPDPAGPYPRGLHTLSVTDHAIVIDGKTREFAWTAPLIKSIWAASHRWRRWRE